VLVPSGSITGNRPGGDGGYASVDATPGATGTVQENGPGQGSGGGAAAVGRARVGSALAPSTGMMVVTPPAEVVP